jgi:predicted metalloprotease with PDZ domain
VTEAAVAIGVEAGGVPVAPPGPSAVAIGLQTTVLQEQLAEVQRQLTEITRQAHEARDVVQSLRGEREQIGRELGELRQQVRAAQEQSLRETREGYSKVGHELNATAGRLGEAVRQAQQELAEVVRQAREARRELEDLRRQSAEGRRDEVVIPAASRPSEGASRAESPAEVEHPNRLGVTVGNGVVVADVLPESPAATAGLTRGDVIEEVNGAGVVSAVQLRDAVVRVGANDWVTLRVVRAGETHELRARLAPEPADEGRDTDRNRLGVTVGPGVIVAEVLPGSPAATAGLATGDVIDGFNGRPVHSAHELRELVFHTPDAGDAALRVTRAGEVHEMRVLLSPR